MKFIDEYREMASVRHYSGLLKGIVTRPWTLMEICGGQTHTIVKYGIEGLLPKGLTMIHGPGCPVCVTSLEFIDKALTIASQSDVILAAYGDMLRVPGSKGDLLSVRGLSGDVRIVYSPLDALRLAERHPKQRVVFFAVGFETTAPASAMAVIEAKRRGINNFLLLCSHVLVPPAIVALLGSKQNRIQAFLAAGHVCTVMGYEEYEPICERYEVPIVVTGFEPLDIVQGTYLAVKQLEEGRCEVQNQYLRAVQREGNRGAKEMMARVFEIVDRNWRGIGLIPQSGLSLRDEFQEYDAEKFFSLGSISTEESTKCVAGAVLQGLTKPRECAAFGRECTPEHPLGAPMVSSEGSCAAYFRYASLDLETPAPVSNERDLAS